MKKVVYVYDSTCEWTCRIAKQKQDELISKGYIAGITIYESRCIPDYKYPDDRSRDFKELGYANLWIET